MTVLNFLLMIADESNREKIEYIYYKYHDDMIRFARYKLKDYNIDSYELDSEDVVQNAFLKIVKYIDAIDISKPENQLKSYIFSIVANETKNFIEDATHYDDIDIYAETMIDDYFFDKLQINIRYEHVVEKIKMLAEYLPKSLVNNPIFYGIVSKGIHELSEKDCLEFFPVMQSFIMMILRQWEKIRRDEEEEKKLAVSLSNIAAKIK